MKSKERTRVLIAGIGGASLGTEILKCLLLADRYTIFGADISPYAFGHYQGGFDDTFVVDRSDYIGSILEVCRRANIDFVVPGADETTVLLMQGVKSLNSAGVRLACNSAAVVDCFSNKARTFELLTELGFPTPRTAVATDADDLAAMTFPCVVKPASGTGGSAFVFLASDRNEAALYIHYLTRAGKIALVQEYLPADEGEFTVGVLSLPEGEVAGSVALKRSFTSKLSVLTRSEKGLISSGYSQGLIEAFPEVCVQAEELAGKVGSVGPLNIQGRLREGILVPFEINPRFSASTYLRALAGFNEIDVFLQYQICGALPARAPVRPGYYLRSLSEVFVSTDGVKT
jgi:carbamoyl-phosphate synthase large subunit